MRRTLWLLPLLAGCASVSPTDESDRFEREVFARLGSAPRAARDEQAEAELQRLIAERLAGETTLDRAVQVALLNNRRLRAELEDLDIAAADLIQAGLLSNPTLQVEIRFPGPPFEIDVAKDFVDLILRPLKLKLAGVALEKTRKHLLDKAVELAADTAAAYFAAQAADRILDLRRTNLAAVEASLEAATRLHQAGNIHDLAQLLEQARAQEARLDTLDAQGEAWEAREKLVRLLGLWGTEAAALKLSSQLPDLPADEVPSQGLEALAVTNRGDLAAARAEVEAAEIDAGLAGITSILPMLDATVHTEREPEGETTIGPSLSIAVPIFDWGQARIPAAQARLRKAGHEYAALAVEIRSQVRVARNKLMIARQRASGRSTVLEPLRGKILKQTLLQYNAMQLGVFTLLSAKQEEIEASRRSVEALRDYWIARAELQRAVGGKLPDATAPSEHKPEPEHNHKTDHKHDHTEAPK